MPRLRRKEVERRQHRRRQLFAAGAGSTEAAAFPDAPTVQILLSSGTWLDISSDVRVQSGVLRTTTGRSAGDSHLRTGSFSFKINNRDGKYSPRNPFSPLFGLIGRNTQVRVTRHGTIRWWGEIPEWPSEWVTGGRDAWVQIGAGGVLRRPMAPRSPVLGSALTRSQVAANPAIGWTLEDDSAAPAAVPLNATSLANMVPNDGAALGGVTDLAGASAVPNLSAAGAYLTAQVKPTIPVTAPWGVEFAAKATESATNAMVTITDSNGNVYALLTPLTLPTFPMAINFYPAGTSSPTAATFLTSPWTTDAQFNNSWHYYQIYFEQVLWAHGVQSIVGVLVYIDGSLCLQTNVNFSPPELVIGSPTIFQASAALPTAAGGPDGTMLSISHVSFFNGHTPSPVYRALTGYTGETAGRRMERLCGEVGVGFEAIGDLDDTTPMGPQTSSKFIDLLFDCEDVDMGFLYESRNSFAVGYRTRTSMYNQAPALGLDYPDGGNLGQPLKPSDNDTRIINDSTAQRAGGSPIRVTLASGPMSVLPPEEGGIGSYPEQITVLPQTDDQAGDIAGWHVGVGTVDAQRFDQMNVNVANTIQNHGLVELANQMINTATGDRIEIDNPPVWAGNEPINLINVGQSEQFNQFLHEIDFDTVLYQPYIVGILDDPVLGRLESDGVTVQSTVDSVTTTFQGLTDTGELYIATAILATFTPPETWINFDVMIGAERCTVTDISGSTNPQTWTVVRSVNGVVGPLIAGTPVYLRNPLRLAA